MTAPVPEVQQAPDETVTPEPAADDSTPPAKPGRTPEEYEAELAKVRREAAGYRVKLKEVEPLAKAAQEAEEAKKDDIQRANDRAQAAEKHAQETLEGYTRLELAVQYHISDQDDIELIGSGTREEMEARAKRVAALNAAAAKATPPPTDRPVEGLRPGASPEPASPPDDSYPEGVETAMDEG